MSEKYSSGIPEHTNKQMEQDYLIFIKPGN